MIRILIHTVLFTVLLGMDSSCSRTSAKKGAATTAAHKTFTLPEVPATLTAPEDHAAYLVAHYWDAFDFTDTTLISKPEITEQALADFINILPYVPSDKAEQVLTGLMASASVDSEMFAHFIELTEKYLYEPNSPFRNEEFCIPVLRYIVASPKLDDLYKIRSQYQLEMVQKNRPGDVAMDFTYTLADGKTGRMHAMKADYTLLFFNNPDCEECIRVKAHIAASSAFSSLTQTHGGKWPALVVLAVYPDAELGLWRKAEYPSCMTDSYDAGQIITKQQLYDLKAIPTLYLLDKDKRVILKDATIETIEQYFQTQ